MIIGYEVKVDCLDEKTGKLEVLLRIKFDLSKEAIKKFVTQNLNTIAKYDSNFREDIKEKINKEILNIIENKYECVKCSIRDIATECIDDLEARYTYWDEENEDIFNIVFLESKHNVKNSLVFVDAYVRVQTLMYLISRILLSILWEEAVERMKTNKKRKTIFNLRNEANLLS